MAMIADASWAFREPHSRDRQRASAFLSFLIHGLLLLFILLTGMSLGGGSGKGTGEGAGKAMEVMLVREKAAAAPAAAAKPSPPMHPRSEVKADPQPKPQVVQKAKAVTKVAKQPKVQASAAAAVLPSVATGFGKGEPESVYGTSDGKNSSTPSGGTGTGTGQGTGAGAEIGINGMPLPPKKGKKLTSAEVRERMVGHTFQLEIGRVEQANSNRLIDSTIQLNADGTTNVRATAYYNQTAHGQYSSTDAKQGTGAWWIEGNRWCHKSEDIQYNTSNCYDVTVDGPLIRFYYAECKQGSTPLCAQGQLAAQGTMK